VGDLVGVFVGVLVGVFAGAFVGALVGVEVRTLVGVAVRDFEGADDLVFAPLVAPLGPPVPRGAGRSDVGAAGDDDRLFVGTDTFVFVLVGVTTGRGDPTG
jgi:hypothetical protein